MADHHDDDLAATKTEGFKVGEKKTLQEYQELGEFLLNSTLPPFNLNTIHIITTVYLTPHCLTFNQPYTDKDDEAMNRWKASLGLNAGEPIGQPNDPKCVIKSLALVVAGREDVVIDLSTPESVETLKNKPFTIKEGAKFKIKVTFQVNHEVLSGLKYVHAVKRKGIRVSKDEEMLGSFAPSTTVKPLYVKECTYTSLPSNH